MEKRLNISLNVKNLYGFAKNARNILKNMAGITLGISKDKIPIDMFNSKYLPYETSKTYREIMTEFQLNRTKAIVEAHRQVFCVR